VTRKGARRRSDGIFYRQWNDTWYSSITGRKLLFYDSHGQRFKGRHNEAAAKKLRLKEATFPPGPYPGLLPGLRALEDTGAMDAAVGTGRCPTDAPGGTGQDSKRRRRPADANPARPVQRHRQSPVRDRTGRRQKVLLHRLGDCPIASRDGCAGWTGSRPNVGENGPKLNVTPFVVARRPTQ